MNEYKSFSSGRLFYDSSGESLRYMLFIILILNLQPFYEHWWGVGYKDHLKNCLASPVHLFPLFLCS